MGEFTPSPVLRGLELKSRGLFNFRWCPSSGLKNEKVPIIPPPETIGTKSKRARELYHICPVAHTIILIRSLPWVCQRHNSGLLAELDGELALGRGHLTPQLLQIVLQDLIVRLPVKGHGKPAVRGGQVAGRAGSGGVERAERNHGFGIGLLGGGLE